MSGLHAGIDEAGRGPLAGPVYAACVVLDPAHPIDGLTDSKLLSPARRERLAEQIRQRALAWCVASASVSEIDARNILQATFLAMRRAFEGLSLRPALALIDGNQDPSLGIATRTLIKGDLHEPAISAASILAKTARDAEMMRLHADLPAYRFDLHKGYPTPLHLQLLRGLGPTPHHRTSFAPVRAVLTATVNRQKTPTH